MPNNEESSSRKLAAARESMERLAGELDRAFQDAAQPKAIDLQPPSAPPAKRWKALKARLEEVDFGRLLRVAAYAFVLAAPVFAVIRSAILRPLPEEPRVAVARAKVHEKSKDPSERWQRPPLVLPESRPFDLPEDSPLFPQDFAASLPAKGETERIVTGPTRRGPVTWEEMGGRPPDIILDGSIGDPATAPEARKEDRSQPQWGGRGSRRASSVYQPGKP